MKVTLEVDIEPFQTPNFARGKKQREEDEGVAYPLHALDSYTLERLCDDFRSEVFKKAGKQRPPQPG